MARRNTHYDGGKTAYEIRFIRREIDKGRLQWKLRFNRFWTAHGSEGSSLPYFFVVDGLILREQIIHKEPASSIAAKYVFALTDADRTDLMQAILLGGLQDSHLCP